MTTTNEIADKIAADNGLSKVQAKGIVEACSRPSPMPQAPTLKPRSPASGSLR